jgi:TetR/AcrR family transcriptional repressor of mexJK operon
VPAQVRDAQVRDDGSLRADRSARKREAVQAAATALFLHQGFAGTSMDQIARQANVSKPTVYRFFPDKEQLLTAIVLGTLDRAGGPFRAELAELAQTAALADDLTGLARRYLDTVLQPAVLQLRRLVIGAAHQLPGLARAYYEQAPDQTMRALAGCFGQLTARGLLRPCDPLAAASHFAFLVLGYALDRSMFCGDAEFTRPELDAMAATGTAAFLAAYGEPA